uniref:Predicted protein n=1 Tax=Hordeum vulgare subsp. vulgare TaxID=112509 RepID=F2D3T8_HORVV|nr:predicted protein [Hordeum vulgare subsp. vulgare]
MQWCRGGWRRGWRRRCGRRSSAGSSSASPSPATSRDNSGAAISPAKAGRVRRRWRRRAGSASTKCHFMWRRGRLIYSRVFCSVFNRQLSASSRVYKTVVDSMCRCSL